MDKLKFDIYYQLPYLQLFSKLENLGYKIFKYQSGSNIAIYPFQIGSINKLGYSLDNQYYDIQGAYGYNGVVTNSYDSGFISEFYRTFEKYCRENRIIAEFTRFHPLLENHKFSQKHMQVVFDRYTVALELEKNYEDIWKTEYSSKNRNMIRKAEKLGYTCDLVFKPAKSDIDNFIDIYNANMRAVAAESYYFFSDTFFYETFDLLKEYTYLFNIIDDKGELLCSSIIFKYNDFIHYHLSGRSLEADNSVNNYLLDRVVKFGLQSGSKLFHLGGGRSGASYDSLLKFKKNFSKTTKSFYIGKKVHNQQVYDEVVKQWEERSPEKKEKYRNHLLKYRF